MILYNVTVSIDPEIQLEWTRYMTDRHIPEVLATKCFDECTFYRVRAEEEGGLTFAIGYLAPNQAQLDVYLKQYAAALRADFDQHWAGKYAAFRTNLEVIQKFVR